MSSIDIDRDGPEVANLASEVYVKIAQSMQQGKTKEQAITAAEEWLYSEERSVPEGYYSDVLAEAETMMPWT